jgi:hypothetical protein
MIIEGSGSIPLTNGSGSGSRKPKNILGSGFTTLAERVAKSPFVKYGLSKRVTPK